MDSEEREVFEVTLLTPNGERTIRVPRGVHIWDAASAQGLKLPALCHQGWCLTCAGRIEQGEVDQSDSVAFYEQDKSAGFSLLCTGRPRSDVTIRTHQATEMRKHRLAEHLPSPYSAGLE